MAASGGTGGGKPGTAGRPAPAGKLSAAQQAALKKFEAAGRAALARRTPAQLSAAARKAAATRRADARAAKAGKPRRPAKPWGAPGPGIPGGWLGGLNDVMPTCAGAAVANLLLLTAGVALGDEEIAAAALAAGGVIPAVAEAMGGRPWRWPGDPGTCPAGAVLGVVLPGGRRHAVLALDQRVWVSWGGPHLPRGRCGEAWLIGWDSTPLPG